MASTPGSRGAMYGSPYRDYDNGNNSYSMGTPMKSPYLGSPGQGPATNQTPFQMETFGHLKKASELIDAAQTTDINTPGLQELVQSSRTSGIYTENQNIRISLQSFFMYGQNMRIIVYQMYLITYGIFF